MSSAVSSNSTACAFSISRSRREVLGIATTSCPMTHRIITCGMVRRQRDAIAATRESSSRRPLVSGAYDSSWMPRARQNSSSSR